MATSSSKHDNGKQDDLDRLAREEILKETKRARERAETMGPIGWVKCPLQPTNKRFFRNVLMGTMTHSKHRQGTKKDYKKSSKTSLGTTSAALDSYPSRNRDKMSKHQRTSSYEQNSSSSDPTLNEIKCSHGKTDKQYKHADSEKQDITLISINEVSITCKKDSDSESNKDFKPSRKHNIPCKEHEHKHKRKK